jgi:hypothetical protein
MDKPWENDSCEAVQAYFTVYPVRVAAALWCGIPPAEVDENLALSKETARGVFAHPYIPCLEPRCRAIHDAIEKGLLPCSRETGKVVEEHVARERRHVSRQHLKDWIAAQFPSDKPAFLFDEIERSTHSAINLDAYQALKIERDGLRARLEKAAQEYRTLRSERDKLLAEKQAPAEETSSPKPLGSREATSYLNIIGAMAELFLAKTPAGKPHSVFTSRGAVIDALVASYGDRDGISKRGLEDKFAAGRKSLGS